MRFILSIILVSCSLFALSQFDYPIIEIEEAQLLATYSLKWQEDSLDSNFIRQEDMLLFIGKNTSKFTSNDNYRLDTITRKIKSWNEFKVIAYDRTNPLPHSAIRYRIFKNYPLGKLTCLDHTLDGTFKYEEALDFFNWQLTGDTATISGYNAQKALCSFGGREWIAWFSPELPFNDGPFKFNGLPGLIVKIFDTQMHYEFELVSIEKPFKKLMIDYVKKDFIEATKQEFFRAKDASRVDIINRAKAAGLPSESQQRAARNMKKRNNPLELKRK